MISYRERMIQDMQLHGYSEGTQESYVRAMRQFVEFCGVPPAQITEEQARAYFLHRQNEDEWSASTLKIAYYGVKFFFTYTLKRDWDTLRLLRGRRERKLPTVLSVEEVRLILAHARRPCYKAFLRVTYGCGLRLSEALHVQVRDIDSDRMVLHVHLGKGAKDRYVPLPTRTLEALREYWKTHRNPVWLFPRGGSHGPHAGTADGPMSGGAVRNALHAIVKGVPRITKPVRMHTLRHSYATHLLEAGVPIRVVQEYLGHARLSSTMIYAHITPWGHEHARAAIEGLMGEVSS